ncbi:ATP-binding protein [Halobacteria archaeon AArc-curdl1]|uniref:ATP-binding protein n=1 Tax=Natronosalvus hydrolyticus TaxID=2979988 RepID=A0AAP2ZCT2_9EURY|nr:ATP-binding protein [Halobacteria archaeon AArc-curdl1]
MLSPALDEITLEEIQLLIEESTPERQDLEFKRQLDPTNNNHKDKFLAEITSLANTTGGDLLIGVPDPDDVDDTENTDLFWITDYEPDDYKLRWESIIRNNTHPRLSTHEIRTIPRSEEDEDGFITIVRVQPSTLSPHRVTRQSKKPFYARNSAGKYELNVEQLREKFIEQYHLREDIEQFLADRIAKIRAGDVPVPYETGPAMVLHVIPASAFTLRSEIDISSDSENHGGLPLLQRDRGGQMLASARRNVDGIVNSHDLLHTDPENLNSEYVQLYRDGRIEAVHTFHFRKDFSDDQIGFWTLYEILHDRLPDYSGFLSVREISLPVFMYLTFIDLEGYVLASDTVRDSRELDRDLATLPPVTLETFDKGSKEVTNEFMRNIWHAFGEMGDPFDHFDEP